MLKHKSTKRRFEERIVAIGAAGPTVGLGKHQVPHVARRRRRPLDAPIAFAAAAGFPLPPRAAHWPESSQEVAKLGFSLGLDSSRDPGAGSGGESELAGITKHIEG